MRSAQLSTSLLCGLLFLGLSPSLFAATYTQSEIVDLILARDTVLAELDHHLSAETPGSGLLRSVRNPEVRYSYGEDSDEVLEDGIQLDQDRDAWEVDFRVFIPNPYEVKASKSEAEASHYGVKAAAQDYLSRKLLRARELWAELRYTTSMMEALSELAPFWESAGRSLSDASAEGLNLGPDLVSWQMDRFQFMEAKQDIDSRHRNALHGLASLAGVIPADLDPVFSPVSEIDLLNKTFSEESAALLSQKSRVARERAGWAELQAVNIPWLDHVQGSYGELTSDYDRESWSVQVAVSLPIFSILSGAVSEQRALLLAEEASLKLMRQQQQEAVFTATELVDRKTRILKLYDREILPFLATMRADIRSSETEAGASLDQKIGLADSILRAVERYYGLQLELEQALIELDTLQGVSP